MPGSWGPWFISEGIRPRHSRLPLLEGDAHGGHLAQRLPPQCPPLFERTQSRLAPLFHPMCLVPLSPSADLSLRPFGGKEVPIDEKSTGTQKRSQVAVDGSDLILFEPMQGERRDDGVVSMDREPRRPVSLPQVRKKSTDSRPEPSKGSPADFDKNGIRVDRNDSTA